MLKHNTAAAPGGPDLGSKGRGREEGSESRDPAEDRDSVEADEKGAVKRRRV